MSAQQKNPGKIIFGIAVFAFLAFAGLTVYSVNHLSSKVDNVTVSSHNGIPSSWDDIATSASTTSVISAEVKDGYVAYVASIENTDMVNPISITHIASFFDGESRGFVPLSANSLEYSYYPESSASWSKISVTDPGKGADSFKLSSAVYLGTAGSSNSKVYFRYYVSPSENGVINDKVAFITESSAGQTSISTASSEIAYEQTTTTEIVAASDNTRTTEDDNSGNSAFTEPLGATSESPSANILPVASIGAITLSPDIMTSSIIILVACLGIFAISLSAYLILRRNAEKRHREF